MTRTEITGELFGLLNQPPEIKKCVTYALVQIRKILEYDKEWAGHSGLKFFCDWALHIELDRKGARHILSVLDERLGHYRPSVPESIDPDGKAIEIFSFGLFRRCLLDFLMRYDLPTVWAEDQFVWNKMLMFYSEQVCHTPLTMTRKDYKFRYLRKLVITSLEPSKAIVEANPKEKHFGFTWEFVLNDGYTFRMPYTSNLPVPPTGWKTRGLR